MKKGDLFPIASSYSVLRNNPNYRVQYTGEFRYPKIHEFFISGAIPEGYQASHNMCVAYHIGKLVKVKIETIVTVVEDEITTADGLLYRNGKIIGLPEADRVAREHGCNYAEEFVRELEKAKT